MLYARALLLRNCGRFTHVSSDFGSQYHTHTFLTSEALYAGLTREITWRHEGRFVDLEADRGKSAGRHYFFCDYDVASKPIWFTPGLFVDEGLRLLPKRAMSRRNHSGTERPVVDTNDFNVVDEDYPGTGGRRPDGTQRRFYCPTYGRIESVLPDHRLFTCALSPLRDEIESFAPGQTFLMGKKRTMFQLMRASALTELLQSDDSTSLEEHQPVQVKLDEVKNFREYQVIAGTARYLLVRGVPTRSSFAALFDDFAGTGIVRRFLPAFWVERVKELIPH